MAHTTDEAIEIGPIAQGYPALLQLVREAARLTTAGEIAAPAAGEEREAPIA